MPWRRASRSATTPSACCSSNAGIPARGGFLELPEDRIEEVARINYLGGVWCLRAFRPLLERGAPSHLVNVASVAGTVAFGPSGPYAAAKHAQVAFSRNVAAELAGRGIRVHTICPGPVETRGIPADPGPERPVAARRHRPRACRRRDRARRRAGSTRDVRPRWIPPGRGGRRASPRARSRARSQTEGAPVTRIGAGLSQGTSTADAARDAAHTAVASLAGASVDLAFLFLSPQHLDEAEDAADAVRAELAPRHLLGCVAQGIVGGSREVEEGPALAVWTASLARGGDRAVPRGAGRDGHGPRRGRLPRARRGVVVALLVDPYTFPAAPLSRPDERGAAGRSPSSAVSQSAGTKPVRRFSSWTTAGYEGGAVGAVLRNVPVRTVVSQGCAPIGRDAVITRAEGNVVYELAGQPVVERLRRSSRRFRSSASSSPPAASSRGS